MKPLIRFGAIVGGYVLALALAWAVLALYVTLTDTPERQASAGMASFGDAFVFLGVFGVAALPPTAAALWAMRPCRRCWRVLAILNLAIAGTALLLMLAYAGGRTPLAHPRLQWLAMLAPLRILCTPPLALMFAATAACAPERSSRIALALAALVEVAALAGFVGLLSGSAR